MAAREAANCVVRCNAIAVLQCSRQGGREYVLEKKDTKQCKV